MKQLAVFWGLLLSVSTLFGQVTKPAFPVVAENWKTQTTASVFLAPPEINIKSQQLKQPAGIIRDVDINFFEKATRSFVENTEVYLLQIVSSQAQALSLYFSDFYMPAGDELFIYNNDVTTLIGAITDKNNTASKLFATAPISADTILIEYVRKNRAGRPSVYIASVGHLWAATPKTAGNCQVDVNCSEGSQYQDVKRSVLRVLTTDGNYQYWGTGVIVNNTAQDYTPYFLSAQHNMTNSNDVIANPELAQQFVFYFNFEQPECNGQQAASLLDNQTMVGASLIAHSNDYGGNEGSDMLLLQLNNSIPQSYNPYFAGWNRQNSIDDNNFSIHHPDGDVKKISFTSSASSDSYGEIVYDTHWKVYWKATANGHGTTEQGSSGAPLFDAESRVIGTLTGGLSSCYRLNDPDWYGKMSYHWNGNSTDPAYAVEHWLAAGDETVVAINGINYGEGNAIESLHSFTFNVWPTQIQSSIVLKFDAAFASTVDLSIYSLSGKLVFQREQVFSEQPVFLPPLQTGVYLLSAVSGNIKMTKKLFIH